jgi:hypothetical protein
VLPCPVVVNTIREQERTLGGWCVGERRTGGGVGVGDRQRTKILVLISEE